MKKPTLFFIALMFFSTFTSKWSFANIQRTWKLSHYLVNEQVIDPKTGGPVSESNPPSDPIFLKLEFQSNSISIEEETPHGPIKVRVQAVYTPSEFQIVGPNWEINKNEGIWENAESSPQFHPFLPVGSKVQFSILENRLTLTMDPRYIPGAPVEMPETKMVFVSEQGD